jgi:hypothetical protein
MLASRHMDKGNKVPIYSRTISQDNFPIRYLDKSQIPMPENLAMPPLNFRRKCAGAYKITANANAA